MTNSLSIHRDRKGFVEKIGAIDRTRMTFRYDAAYLNTPEASPLSFSLPLRESEYAESEFRPYFEGLLPEGVARQELASELKVREGDYLSILADSGLDCIGDVVVNLEAYRAEQSYEPLTLSEVKNIFSHPLSIAEASIASRLSLAGTQGKVGLFHDENFPPQEGWSLPRGGAASTHVLKAESLENLSLVEYLCMECAKRCGVKVANTTLLDLGAVVICSERFDRNVVSTNRGVIVERLHQEDLTQAFGLLPGSKYAEIEPSTAAAITKFLRLHALRPLAATQDFARIACFNYLIGNCDNHLKNLSMLQGSNGHFATLAPAYDLVSTTVFDRFSRIMGMRIGEAASIDDVTVGCFTQLANDLGLSLVSLKLICRILLKKTVPSLNSAAANIKDTFPLAPYLADDIEEDLAPRLHIMQMFCDC